MYVFYSYSWNFSFSQFNIYNFIDESQCEVLNASDDKVLHKILQGRPDVVTLKYNIH